MADEIKLLEVDVAGLAKSIQNAKVELDSLRIALDATTEAEGKNSEATTIAKAAYDAQNKSVKQLEGALLRVTQAEQALGENIQDIVKNYDASNKSIDQNRKVLNALTAEYNKLGKEGREKLAPSIKQISDELKKQEGAIGDTRRNVGNYKEAITSAFGELKGFGGQLVSVGQNIGGAVNAFKAAEGGVKGFGAALATTGLPLIIMGINALTEAFSSFKPIADAVEQAMGGLAFAFGSGYDEGVKLTKAIQDLEDAQREAIVTNALYAKSINELEAQAANKAAKDEDRINALKQANKLRLEQLNEEKKIAKEQARIADEEVKNSIGRAAQMSSTLTAFTLGFYKTTAEASDDAVQKQKEAQARIIQLDDAFNQATISNQNKIDLLEQQLDADRKKRAEERFRIENGAISKALKEQQVGYDKFNQAYDEQQKVLKNKEDEKEQREVNAQLKREIRILNDIGTEKAAVDAIILQRNIDLQNQDLTETERLLIIEDSERKIAEIRKKYRDKESNDSYDAYLEWVKLEREKVQASSLASNAIVGFIGQVGEALGAGAKFQKAVAFAQILINQAIAIANAVVGATSSGASTGPAAVVTTPTFIATMIGAVTAVFGSLVSLFSKADVPSSPKFAEGGSVFDVGGKPHSSGGTKYVGEDGNRFEVERGEKIFVMKATASKYIDALGGVNMMFGGRSWGSSSVRFAAQGGSIQDGGFVARNTTQRADELATQKALISTLLKSMPAPVVSVQEINKVNNGRNKSVAVSEL